MRTESKYMGIILATLALGGCAFDASTSEEDLASEQQKYNMPWSPPAPLVTRTVGMARNVHDDYYMFTDVAGAVQDGIQKYAYCRGPASNPCFNGVSLYRAPAPASLIRGVAISATNGALYAFYSRADGVGLFSKGNANDFGTLQSFTLPVGLPAGSSMKHLLEVEQSSGGAWHYWWKLPDGTMKLSVSNTPASGGTVRAGNVNHIPAPWKIVGIVMRPDVHPNQINTYFTAENGANNWLNIGWTPQDLFKP